MLGTQLVAQFVDVTQHKRQTLLSLVVELEIGKGDTRERYEYNAMGTVCSSRRVQIKTGELRQKQSFRR